jgi:hypothetical protein
MTEEPLDHNGFLMGGAITTKSYPHPNSIPKAELDNFMKYYKGKE